MPGVKKIVPITGGVGVIADNTWRAIQAAEAIDFDWGDAPYPAEQADHWSELSNIFDDDHLNAEARVVGDVDAADGELISGEYRSPYLAHAPLEPLNATILVTDDRDQLVRVAHFEPDELDAAMTELERAWWATLSTEERSTVRVVTDAAERILGRGISVRGKVAPARPGETVTVLGQHRGKTVKLGTTRAGVGGHVATTLRLPWAGDWRIVLEAPGRKGVDVTGRGASEPMLAYSDNPHNIPSDASRYIVQDIGERILYYYEEMTMKEIGATLDLSESRVSQMHSSILARLKAQMQHRSREFEPAPAH